MIRRLDPKFGSVGPRSQTGPLVHDTVGTHPPTDVSTDLPVTSIQGRPPVPLTSSPRTSALTRVQGLYSPPVPAVYLYFLVPCGTPPEEMKVPEPVDRSHQVSYTQRVDEGIVPGPLLRTSFLPNFVDPLSPSLPFSGLPLSHFYESCLPVWTGTGSSRPGSRSSSSLGPQSHTTVELCSGPY